MADMTETERIVALIDKAGDLARLICPFPEEVDEGAPIERMPDDLLQAATTLGDLAQALATARETAQREAEARLLELRTFFKYIFLHQTGREIHLTYETVHDAQHATVSASEIRALPGAEPWEKLLKAAKVRAASGHQDTCGAVLVEVEDRSIECDCGYSELERALASFGEREGK